MDQRRDLPERSKNQAQLQPTTDEYPSLSANLVYSIPNKVTTSGVNPPSSLLFLTLGINHILLRVLTHTPII